MTYLPDDTMMSRSGALCTYGELPPSHCGYRSISKYGLAELQPDRLAVAGQKTQKHPAGMFIPVRVWLRSFFSQGARL